MRAGAWPAEWMQAALPLAVLAVVAAEAESHVADTGEDPREAFGPARDHAAGSDR